MRVVVSLTSIPSRIQFLGSVMKCILEQTHQIDRIYINLPKWSKKEKCVYPPVSSDIAEHPLVTILKCDDDWGSLTKLYPVLGQAISRLCHHSKWKHCGAISSILGHDLFPKKPVKVDSLQGVSGCLYRRKFFPDPKVLLDYQGCSTGMCFRNDDLWISANLAKNGVGRMAVPSSRRRRGWFHAKLGGQTEAHKVNPLSAGGLFNHTLPVMKTLLYFRRQGLFTETVPWNFWHSSIFFDIGCGLILFILASLVRQRRPS